MKPKMRMRFGQSSRRLSVGNVSRNAGKCAFSNSTSLIAINPQNFCPDLSLRLTPETYGLFGTKIAAFVEKIRSQ
jgi:hypothetical protein